MRIDSHHHLWRYDSREYAWIDENMGVLRRDYLAEGLEGETARAGIGATIAVQARQTLEETRWLLEVAGAHPMIRGVVGWVPLIEEGVADVLAELSSNLKLRGVRHVLQDEPDDAYMLREDFNLGIRFAQALRSGLRRAHLREAIGQHDPVSSTGIRGSRSWWITSPSRPSAGHRSMNRGPA